MQLQPVTPRIRVPSPPAADVPHGFPVMATLAPVGVSAVIFAVTQSPLSLLFAALGPVIAIGSLVDARVQARRRSRREAARFARELAAAEAQLRAAHAAERAALERLFPPASGSAARWSTTARDVALRLGIGPVASASTVDGAPADRSGNDTFATAIAELVQRSATLAHAPVTVPAVGGIGVIGPRVLAEPVLRALVLGAAARLHPSNFAIEWGGASSHGSWLDDLPHPVRRSGVPSAGLDVRFEGDGGSVRLIHAESIDQLPPGVATAVVVSGRGGSIAGGDGSAIPELDRMSSTEARDTAALLAARALAAGLAAGDATLAASVDLSSLEQSPVSGSLAATIGVGRGGPVALDLVAHGPHAVVGGTTGSGKSELLITWVLALAASHPPSVVNFLLVDFKGGAAFGALASLPHCVGVITDLDEQGARRAFESLSAELRFRERFLADRGARSIGDPEASTLARLVIVVDEFAAVASGLPDLRDLFADLAARGRSLGIHLVLCTQRPTGVVRDNVLANCSLRISLRVNNRADSTAVVGTDAAALLPLDARGRALVAGIAAEPIAVQFALAVPADIARAATLWSGASPPRRPWLDPLPAVVPLDSLPAALGGVPFGLVDRPDQQAQPLAVWQPERDGHLLVLGSSNSGRSRTLAVLAEGGVVHGPHDPEAAWDAVGAALEHASPRRLLIDDLDVLVGRFGADHASEFVDRLSRLLREGVGRGVHVAVVMQRITPALGTVASLTSARVVLRLADRQEHVLAGAPGDSFRDDLPPGAGLWKGRSLQVALGPTARAPDPVAVAVASASHGLAVIAAYPRECAGRLRAAFPKARITLVANEPPGVLEVSRAGAPRVLVGDPDDWQSRWGAIAALRETVPLLFDGCSVADYRAVTRDRRLPPPLVRPDTVWLVGPRAAPVRARLPTRGG